MIKLCKYWIELYTGETCRGNSNKNCTCSGVKSQCNYPEYFEGIKINMRDNRENMNKYFE